MYKLHHFALPTFLLDRKNRKYQFFTDALFNVHLGSTKVVKNENNINSLIDDLLVISLTLLINYVSLLVNAMLLCL